MKINSIQYLRGIAAMVVVIAHAFEHQIAGENFPLLRLGSLGVIMFFVISGFIMVFISGETSFSPGRFLRRRLVRVVPLYWLATAAVALLALVAPSLLRRTTFALDDLALSLLFIPHYDDAGGLAPMLTLGWTLNYEIFFYLCFAAFSFLRASTRVATLTITFIIMIVLGGIIDFESPQLQFYTRPIVGAFCIGMWAGLATIRGWSLREWDSGLVAAGLIFLLLFATAFLIQPGTRGDWQVTYAFAFGSVALLMLALGMEDRIPASNIGMLLGDASYSLYLSHMYAVAAALLVMGRFVNSDNLILNASVAIAGGLILGVLVHKFVEKPLLTLFPSPRRRATIASNSIIHMPKEDDLPPRHKREQDTEAPATARP